MRLAIFDSLSGKWSAGGEYTRTQICTLLNVIHSQHRDAEIIVANSSGKPPVLPHSINTDSLHCVKINSSDYLSTGQVIMRRGLGTLWKDPRNRVWEKYCDEFGFDVVFHQSPPAWWRHKSVGLCCWIPDFQHVHFPEFFSSEEIRIRNDEGQRIAEQADLIILSSEAVRNDFIKFAPDYADKTRIYKFPSQYAFIGESERVNADLVLNKYGIKRGFFLVVNQFFAHKNHEQIIEAVVKLKEGNDCPQVVMIGQPVDYRDPSGKYLSKLLSMIAEYGVESKIKVLGYVSRQDKDILLRSCRALIQPSRFEGWNTSIEDAKALGRPILASDIVVHREQLGDSAFGYFGIDNIDQLVGLMKLAGDNLPATVDYEVEKKSLQMAKAEAVIAGELLFDIAAEAQKLKSEY